jgi:hypothetical protein
MGDGSMFNAIYLEIITATSAKAEVMNAKTSSDTIILDSVLQLRLRNFHCRIYLELSKHYVLNAHDPISSVL